MNEFTITASKKVEAIDITEQVQAQVPADAQGLCLVFTPHSTVALTIAENEQDLMLDYERLVETLLSPSRPFRHCGHGIPNAEAHLFGALQGCSVLVPVEEGKLRLGKFQRVLLFELDGPRPRQVWVGLYG